MWSLGLLSLEFREVWVYYLLWMFFFYIWFLYYFYIYVSVVMTMCVNGTCMLASYGVYEEVREHMREVGFLS